MSLFEQSKERKEEIFSGTVVEKPIYSPSNPYEINPSAIENTIGYLSQYVGSLFSGQAGILSSTALLSVDNELSRVARERLLEQVALRIGREAAEDFLPQIDIGRVFKGESPIQFPIDERITVPPNFLANVASRIGQLSGGLIYQSVFDEQDARFSNPREVDKKLYDTLGPAQKRYHDDPISKDNYYSKRVNLLYSVGNPADRVNYFYDYSRRGVPYRTYIATGSTPEELIRNQDAFDRVNRDNPNDISTGMDRFVHDGKLPSTLNDEFGKNDRLKPEKYDPKEGISESNGLGDTLINRKLEQDVNALDRKIIWGRTGFGENGKPLNDADADREYSKFGARRGLLRYTAQIMAESNIGKETLVQTAKSWLDENGDVVYRGGYFNQYTPEEYYGRDRSTLKRSDGNFVSDSVLENGVIPRIFPQQSGTNKDQPNKSLMLSIENLAYRKEDLVKKRIPWCEHGPNGGRIMWFAPYIKNYTDTVTVNSNKFQAVGRTEPILTYNNTLRSGSLSFMLIIDYPAFMDYDNGNVDEFTSVLVENRIYDVFGRGGADTGFTLTPQRVNFSQTERRKVVPDSIDSIDPDPTIPDPNPTTGNRPDPSNTRELTVDFNTNFKYYFDNDVYQVLDYYEALATSGTSTLIQTYQTSYISQLVNNGQKAFHIGIPLTSAPNYIVPDRTFYALNAGFFPIGGPYEASNVDSKSTLLGFELDESIDIVGFPEFKRIDFLKMEIEANATPLFNTETVSAAVYNSTLAFRRAVSMLDQIGINTAEYKIPNNGTNQWFLAFNSGVKNASDLVSSKLSARIQAVAPGTQEKIELVREPVSLTDNSFKITLIVNGPRLIDIENDINVLLETVDSKEDKQQRYVDVRVNVNDDAVKEANNILRDRETEEGDTRGTDPGSVGQTRGGGSTTNTDPSIETERESEEDEFENVRMNTYDCTYSRFENSKQKNIDRVNFVVDNIGINKRKNFSAAYHSQTPEDFHRRMTFLHQLGYPGDSNTEIFSKNSAFGRPPYAILRLGDFWHGKIFIDNINFSFDNAPWDMNPEGMGMQPMVCTVDMQFTFTGGHSLSTHIERLQNAFSFNHLANSTFYRDKDSNGVYINPVEVEESQVEINRIRAQEEEESAEQNDTTPTT